MFAGARRLAVLIAQMRSSRLTSGCIRAIAQQMRPCACMAARASIANSAARRAASARAASSAASARRCRQKAARELVLERARRLGYGPHRHHDGSSWWSSAAASASAAWRARSASAFARSIFADGVGNHHAERIDAVDEDLAGGRKRADEDAARFVSHRRSPSRKISRNRLDSRAAASTLSA